MDMNPDEAGDSRSSRSALSALMDGDDSHSAVALQAWRDDSRVRADWHAFHLIGELMRSDDVRCAPHHDEQFLIGVRERLAREPVVLAPVVAERGPASRVGSARRLWARPMAIAAGFAAVAGVLVVVNGRAPDGVSPGAIPLAQQGTASSAPTLPSIAEGGLIRSAELDRYLAAHRSYGSSSALAAPGGMVRNAAATAPGR